MIEPLIRKVIKKKCFQDHFFLNIYSLLFFSISQLKNNYKNKPEHCSEKHGKTKDLERIKNYIFSRFSENYYNRVKCKYGSP